MILATASAAMPSPLPANPSFSVVVAFIFTASSVMPRSFATSSRMAAIYGANLGRCAIIVTSALLTCHPSFWSISTTTRRRRRLSAPSYLSSVSGKCFPISPLPAAPLFHKVPGPLPGSGPCFPQGHVHQNRFLL